MATHSSMYTYIHISIYPLFLNVPSHSHDHRALSRVPCAIPWRRAWQPTPGSLPGASHGQGSLAGRSPWCLKESDTTEQLNTHTPVLYSKFSLVAYFKLLQSCLTLCDPLVGSPPDSSVHGISQARILEWIAMPSSKGSS